MMRFFQFLLDKSVKKGNSLDEFRKFLSKFQKVLIYFLMLPIYIISLVVPRKKNLWVFGAWFGERYSDNSKYLFEFVNRNVDKNRRKIRAIWLTKNEKVENYLRSKGYEVYRTYSLKGFYYSLRASVGVICSGLRDINMYTVGSMKIIQLWHGIPLKKIMHDDSISFKTPRSIFLKIFPFLLKGVDYSNAMLIATSDLVRDIMASAFRVSKEKVKVTGFPRNDVLLTGNAIQSDVIEYVHSFRESGKKIVLYVPTHRKEGKESRVLLNLRKNAEYINSKLKALNAVMLVKLHYYHASELSNCKESFYENIKLVDDESILGDIYPLLQHVDVLITDYSSIFFDYLLLDRPIVFFPFDIQDYVLEDREFYFDYALVTPGPKAKTWKEVMHYIGTFIAGFDNYTGSRARIRDMFHKYVDANSSLRVFNEIEKELFGREQ